MFSLPLRRNHLLLAICSTAMLAVLACVPRVLGDRVQSAVSGLAGADVRWLWTAGVLFVAMHALGGLSWCVALRACGSRIGSGDAIARYSVGSGLNAVAPLHLGSAVRVALFSRAVGGSDGGIWRVTGAGAAVGAVRVGWLGALLVVGVSAGVLPIWPLLAISAALALIVAVAILSRRVTLRARLGHLLDAFRELGRRPRSLLAVAVATAAGLALKVGSAACVLAALGIERPLTTALVVVPAVELAAVMPLTPGNAGVASAAVALAVGAQGTAGELALSAGIAFGAIETVAAAAIGAAGALALTRPVMPPAYRLAAVGAGSTALAGVFSATVIVPLL